MMERLMLRVAEVCLIVLTLSPLGPLASAADEYKLGSRIRWNRPVFPKAP